MWRLSAAHFSCITFYYWISIFSSTQVKGALDEKVSLLYDNSDEWNQRDVRLAIPTNGELDCEKSDDIYICEEPPYTVPLESNKTCNYRSQNYHEQVYRWVAGRGCLLYTPDFLYMNGINTINLNAFCLYGNLFAPCLEMIKTDGSCGCYPFDPGLENVAIAVREALIPAVHGRWERCFYAAADCCSHYMVGDDSDASQCSATFDGWTCWQAAEAGSVVNEVCSEFAYSNVGPSCNHYSSKECYANSTWELQTDYTTCSITARLLGRYRFHIGMLSFSIVSCLPAVLIFIFYKRLRITRVILHRNLLVAIILRNVLLIISRSEIYIDELTNAGVTVMSTHSVACRVLAIAERVTANAVFVCMLVEGLYMHSLIVTVFKQKFNLHLLYVIGAAIAIIPVVGWATVMAIHNDHSCWLVYTVDNVQWILDAPRIAILIINTILFANVLRVLLTKIRNTENAKQLSAAKATLFLMPIFGTQFLLTALRPNTSNCTGEQIYYYITYSIEGLQGFIVALTYCYINKEVQMLLKATYKKTENAVMDRVRRPSSAPRPSGVKSDRRMTYSTGLPSIDEDYLDGTNAVRGEIHRAEIISIPSSERATVLEPIYEIIQIGNTNEGYESTERSGLDNDSGIIPNRDSKLEDYYGFTNASSVSLEPKECIRYTATPTAKTIKMDGQQIDETDPYSLSSNGEMDKDYIYDVPKEFGVADGNLTEANITSGNDEINQDLFDDILEFMAGYDDVKLDPNVLSPNRKEEDKIAFVDF